MNTGIFYLYEYSGAQKLRNAGFLKIARHYHSCTLQLNARGISVTRTDLLKLCAFYLENGTAKASVLAEITCASHAVSARLNAAESQFPEGRPLPHIDGFLLPLPGGTVLAAAASDAGFDTGRIQFVSPDAQKEELPSAAVRQNEELSSAPESSAKQEEAESSVPSAEQNESETSKPESLSPTPETQEAATPLPLPETQEAAASPPQYIPSEPNPSSPESKEPNTDLSDAPVKMQQSEKTSDALLKTQQAEETSDAPLKMQQSEETSGAGRPAASPQETIRKIQRSELSVLPRKYWSLANNSFLMHGYHNYNHLLLIEEDGHYWLGVPGIYDARESRAAELFGFPQFTDSYNESLSLSEEECNPDETFGYWCRYLK